MGINVFNQEDEFHTIKICNAYFYEKIILEIYISD